MSDLKAMIFSLKMYAVKIVKHKHGYHTVYRVCRQNLFQLLYCCGEF